MRKDASTATNQAPTPYTAEQIQVLEGLEGVGVSVTNGVSEWLEGEVWRDGKAWKQRFARGKKTAALAKTGSTRKTGTRVTFKPDRQVMTATDFDAATIAQRLDDIAYLN